MPEYPASAPTDSILSERKDATYRAGKSRSLLEQLPEIVRAGKRRAEQILEGLEGNTRISLQTRELVTPAKDSNWREFAGLRAGAPISRSASSVGSSQRADQEISAPWFNRLTYGDNLLAMAALLAGDEHTPSLRGKIDLFYIDPPFDSKADYRTKITLPGGDVEQKPTVVEQFAYSDTWADGTASYLAMIVPRLCLMRELLSDRGSIYVQVDWHVGHYVKIVLDEVFGKELFQNEIIWKRSLPHNDPKRYGSIHDTIFFYLKSEDFTFNQQYTPLNDSYIASHYNLIDEAGRKYQLTSLAATGPGPARSFAGKVLAPPAGNHWRYTQENIDKLLLILG